MPPGRMDSLFTARFPANVSVQPKNKKLLASNSLGHSGFVFRERPSRCHSQSSPYGLKSIIYRVLSAYLFSLQLVNSVSGWRENTDVHRTGSLQEKSFFSFIHITFSFAFIVLYMTV